MARKGTAPCQIKGCERKELALGWCAMHYTRWQRCGDPGEAQPRRGPNRTDPDEQCQVDQCTRRMHARGWCPAHLARWRLYGDPLGKAPERPRRTLAEIVPLIERGEIGTTAPKGYRYVVFNGRRYLAHRLVMEFVLGRALYPDEEVHHRFGDRSDNRRENLELWSTSQPAGQRVEDKIAWAREFLARYDAPVP